MKKQLVVALGLAVLATPAFASKARLTALGEDADGSFFINDNRNIFLNAAEVNNHKDLVTFEWGSGTKDAEGGFLKAHNNLVYGLHLGASNSLNDTVAKITPTTVTAADRYNLSNTIDLFVGGDAGVKWGANLSYGAGQDDKFDNANAESEGRTVDLNLGVIMGDLSAYVNAGVLGSVEVDKAAPGKDYEVERKLDVEVGASYKLQNYTVFGQVGMAKFEENETKEELKSQNLTLGAARTEKLNDKTSMFVKLSGNYSKTEYDKATTKDQKDITVPVAIGLEHDATSWLALRGSIKQNLWSKLDNDGDKSTAPASTAVNAGASLLFGDLTVDGMIGAASTTNTNSSLRFDEAMTQVSMTYRF